MNDYIRPPPKATDYYRKEATSVVAKVFKGTGTGAFVLIRNIEALALYLQTGKIPEAVKKEDKQ